MARLTASYRISQRLDASHETGIGASIFMSVLVVPVDARRTQLRYCDVFRNRSVRIPQTGDAPLFAGDSPLTARAASLDSSVFVRDSQELDERPTML